MSIRVPTIAITADGTELTGPQAGLSEALVDVGHGPAHDRARLALGWLSPLATIEPGAEVTVAIGYDDAPETVLTGIVDEVTHRPWGLVVDVLALPARLVGVRVGRSYVEMAAADIVADLLAEADVPAGDSDSGPTLASYHIDERRNAWSHLNELARVAACEISTGSDGSCHFRLAPGAEAGLGGLAGAVTGAASSLLGLGGGQRYGAELHDLALANSAVPGKPCAVAPFGSGSQLGASQWHVLLREPAPDGHALVPGPLRDRDSAAQLEGALSAAAARAASGGWATITGAPTIRAGDVTVLTDLPYSDDQNIRVRAICHRYSRKHGFTSRIRTEGAPA